LRVEPDRTLIIAMAVGSLLLLLMLLIYVKARMNKTLHGIQIDHLKSDYLRQHSIMVSEQKQLQGEVANLALALRKKKHNEQELEVMRKAMDEMSKERGDELRAVLIPSSEVKIERVIGKGAMGVVNLAEYNGIKIAVKQVHVMEEEMVRRFRFGEFAGHARGERFARTTMRLAGSATSAMPKPQKLPIVKHEDQQHAHTTIELPSLTLTQPNQSAS